MMVGDGRGGLWSLSCNGRLWHIPDISNETSTVTNIRRMLAPRWLATVKEGRGYFAARTAHRGAAKGCGTSKQGHELATLQDSDSCRIARAMATGNASKIRRKCHTVPNTPPCRRCSMVVLCIVVLTTFACGINNLRVCVLCGVLCSILLCLWGCIEGEQERDPATC